MLRLRRQTVATFRDRGSIRDREHMRTCQLSRWACSSDLLKSLICVALIIGLTVFPSLAKPPPDSSQLGQLAPNGSGTATNAESPAVEIEKTQAETEALKAIGDRTRWWTTVLAAAGSIVGAIVGGVFTFAVTQMGQRFNCPQKELEDGRTERDRLRREDDEKLSRLKMRQEQERAQELHNLRLFQDLGHRSHRA